jgi:hypothetical protein
VLGESYSKGWRAYCGAGSGSERSLGTPLPIDGFANGWLVSPGCRHVRFQFAPQRTADIAYLVSLAALPILLAVLLVSALRSRGEAASPRLRGARAVAEPFIQLSWLGALTAGAACSLVIGFLFALPIGPLAVPILRRGTTPRRLFGLGGALLLAIPVAYLIRSAPNAGGYDFSFAYDNLLGHWLGVAGMCAIFGGCVLELVPVSRRLAPPALRPPDGQPPPAQREPRPLVAPGASPSA